MVGDTAGILGDTEGSRPRAGLILRKILDCTGGDIKLWLEPIKGVWEAERPAGSRGRAPGQGVRGRSPLKLTAF